MTVHELLLLGLLADGEAHGYELHEFLAEKLHFLTDLTRPTAYRLLDRLHQEGLLSRDVEREGKRPERMRYRITQAGLARLDALLVSQLETIDVLKPAGNVALLFMQRVSPKVAASALHTRASELRARRERLVAHHAELPRTSPARIVLDRNLALIEADLAWLDKQVARLKRQPAHSDPSPAKRSSRSLRDA